MTSPLRITRKEFVSEVASRPIKVADAVSDTRFTGVDVRSADLNGDGKISGKKEAGALFDAIDKVDSTNTDAKSLDITGLDGKSTPVAEKIAAVGDLAKAGKLQKMGRTTQPGNNDVLFVGMRDETKDEAKALSKRGAKAGFNVSYVGGTEKSITSNGKTYDLKERAGIDDFTKSLGLPADQTKRIGDAIEANPKSGRDEMAAIAEQWAKAEKGGQIASRMVISGHHVYEFFGDHGSLQEENLMKLARAMPKAAEQIEDIHLSGCYSLGRDTVRDWNDAFPKLETLWAYDQTAPGAKDGAPEAQGKWDTATRDRIGILGRESAKNTKHSDQVIVWSRTGGYEDSKPTPKKDVLLKNVADLTPAYDKATKGEQKYGNHNSELRDYYNAVRDLSESDDISGANKTTLTDRAERTIRMLYYDTVSVDWAKENKATLTAGYDAAGLKMPSFDKMDRKAHLAEIDKFLTATKDSKDPKVLEARKQLTALKELDPQLLKAEWIR